MTETNPALKSTPLHIGIAADHGGYELKEHLLKMLRADGHEVTDFGDSKPDASDDYPDYVVPLAHAVADGDVALGVAICSSGVGATVAANKVSGVRACLIEDSYTAHQGVEDDDLNMICLGGQVVGNALALELVRTFLSARFSATERHLRRLTKVADLETKACAASHTGNAPIPPWTAGEAMDAWRNEGDPN